MASRQCTEEQFLKDVAEHELKILHDDGLYRHLRFKKPDSGTYWFDITTHPGYLMISGDMGCYVFSRLADMFNFFVLDKHDFNYRKERKIQINVGYWLEKLEADSTCDSLMKFDEDEMKSNINSWFEETPEHAEKFFEEHPYIETTEQFYAACSEFSSDEHYIELCDIGSPEVLTYRPVWILYAIAWGIMKYREERHVQNNEKVG